MAGMMDTGGGLLGLWGSLFNRNQQSQTERQYWNIGDPYRSRLSAITNDPSLYYNSPDAQALANQSDRRYSSLVGNPAGSGTAQAGALEAMLRGYGAEKDRLFHFGGGDYLNRAYPGARQGKMNANMDIFRSLGSLLGMQGPFGGGGGGGPAPGGGAYEGGLDSVLAGGGSSLPMVW